LNQGQSRILWGALLFASLALSALAYFAFLSPLKHIVVFFPTAGRVSLESEVHAIPRNSDIAVEIEQTVKTVLSGPLSMKFKRVAPLKAAVRAVFVRDNVAYVDLLSAIQESDSETPLSIPQRIEVIKKSILQNYPLIRNVVVLVQGQEINTTPYVTVRKS